MGDPGKTLYQIQYRRKDTNGGWQVFHTHTNSAPGVYVSLSAVKGLRTKQEKYWNAGYFEYRIVTATPEWKELTV